ncbi:MAG: hypothetical protein WKF71_20505 [Pyrinomonadaceae bacterium]
MQHGKIVKVKKFAAATHLKMFRVTVSTNRTDYIVHQRCNSIRHRRRSKGERSAMED